MVDGARLAARLGILLLIAALAGCAWSQGGSASSRGRKAVETSKLNNGLTLSVQRDSSIPLVTLDMWVRVGSGDEPPEVAGISHFLEHMLFKGTSRLAVGEYDRRIEEVGGYLNAATSMDYTHYYVTTPSAHFDAVLTDFADVMINSALDAGEVESERQVILEEISRKIDNPFGFLFDETIPALYESGPYRHPVIGSRESVTAITRAQLAEHYRRYYAAGNMYLAIVGDVDPRAARGKVEQAFADAQAKFEPYEREIPESRYAPPRDRVLPQDWNEAYFILAFPGPEGDRMDSMVIRDFAETVLAGGRSSRLVKSLQEKKALVSTIGCYFPNNRHPSPLMIYGTCEAEKLEQVRSEIFAELKLLQEGGIADSEMKRARRQVLNSHLFSLETNAGRASTIGYSQVLLGTPRLLDKYEEQVRDQARKPVEQFITRHLREKDASFHITRRGSGAKVP